MKFNIKSLLPAAALFLMMGVGFTACSDQDAHDDLTGVYAAPTEVSVTSATFTKSKARGLRFFAVNFTSAEGVAVKMTLVSNKYYLDGTNYTLSTYGNAKNGTFIVGSTVNGSVITDGSLTMEKYNDTYTIKNSILFTEDGKAYRLNGTVEMTFEVEPTELTSLLSATANADGTISILLSTGGYTSSYDASTYTTTYSGEGYDFQIVIRSSDGKLHAGTYSPVYYTVPVATPGYTAGYEYEMEYWGYKFTVQGGTLWYTIANGARTGSLVTTGDITVTKTGSTYDILINQGTGGIYAEYTGEIPALED